MISAVRIIKGLPITADIDYISGWITIQAAHPDQDLLAEIAAILRQEGWIDIAVFDDEGVAISLTCQGWRCGINNPGDKVYGLGARRSTASVTENRHVPARNIECDAVAAAPVGQAD